MAGMNIDLNKLKNIKLTKEQQQYVALAILLVAGSIYGYWTQVLVPYRTRIDTLTKQLAEKKDHLEKARRLKNQWEEYTQRLSRVQAGSQYVSRRIPPEATFDLGISRIIRMSTEGGVYPNTFSGDSDLSKRSEYEGFKKVTTNVTFDGDFHKLGNFLSRLSGEDLVYLVEDLKLDAKDRTTQENKRLTTGITFKMITYVEISQVGK